VDDVISTQQVIAEAGAKYHSDRFPVPVRLAVKSNLTSWCDHIKCALNAFTEQASTTEFGKLFHIFTIRAEKKRYVDRSGNYGLEVYSYYL